MVAHELQLEQLPDEKLWSFCRTLGARIRPQNSEGVIPDKTRIEVFAVIREAFRRQFGVRPYNTQMLTALLLSDPKELQRSVGQARGLYAQIQTGEGKSLILSCLSAYFGLLDNRVDVITSDPLLARRDALKFGAFYERFSLPSGRYHYDPQDPVEERDLRVMYTTNDSLIFGFLAAKLEGEKFFQGRRFQIALVDEADNLCLDMSKEACRISTKIDPIVPRPVLEQMLKFVRGKGSSAGSGGIEQFLATCPAAGTISPSLIKTYLNSARYSLSLRRDTDYVVRDRKVVIVDTMNTGRLHHRSQWGAGIHEFVAMREGADAAKVRGLACQMSHPDLLLKYRQLFCISGTFGDEIDRRELAEIYNLRGFDIPRHRPSKRIDTEIELFRSSADRDNAVVRRAQELVAQGRSLLTVSHTIQQSRSLNTAMRAVGVKASLLNDVDNRDADGKECEEFEIIEKAGLPGAVANGTGVIARGADIVTTKQCDEAGGGESIAVDLPTNERTERQIRGRAGRQGKNGSSRIMVCLEDEWFRTIPEGQRDTLRVLMERPELGPSHPMTLATVKLYRVNANVLGAVERRIHHRYARVFQGPQEHYFQACQRFTEALEIKYPDLKEQPGMPRLGNPVLEPLRRKWGAQNELLKHQVDTAQIELRAALEGDDRNLPPSQFFPRILLAFERLYGFPFERIMECREEERLFRNCLRMEVEDMRRVLQRAEAHLAAPLPSAIKDTVEQLQRAVDGWIEELRVTYLVGSTPVPARKKTSEKSNAAEGRSGRNSDSKSGTKPLLTEEMEDAIDRAEERGRSQKKGGPLH
jgi:preprotein translocase subunit SecA